MPTKYIIATVRQWNINNYKKFCHGQSYYLIDNKNDLVYSKIKKINPRYIFFPHWSWLIPKEIWSNYPCVVFHMTALPYGRGGSPLQNLILRGQQKTKISAIKADYGLDSGGIYCQEDLNLSGRAAEIYQRVSEIIFKKMIPNIIKNNPKPKKQTGRVIKFSRRTPQQSRINTHFSLAQLNDFIRMLDAPGYPKAFMETQKLRWEFSSAKFKNNRLIFKVEAYEK